MKQRKLADHIKTIRKFEHNHRLTFKDKNCKYCKSTFTPLAPSHLYCCDTCAATGIAENYYQRNYGLSYQQVEDMLSRQNHLCAICKEEGFRMNDRVYNALNVDHDHETGDVRGLLCHNCNRGLGLFKDSVKRLKDAITYLEGATTIPQGSTHKCEEAHDPEKE